MEIISNVIGSIAGTDKVVGDIVKVDPVTGFCEFPPPGDPKYYVLTMLKDPDLRPEPLLPAADEKQSTKEYWMPDKFCKVCFACEDSFTMYRRRHHCRICGQVFCNPCSSFYIDGELINMSGSVRACEQCYKHLEERGDLDLNVKNRVPDATGLSSGLEKVRDSIDHKKLSLMRHVDYLASVITPAFLAGKIDKQSSEKSLFPVPPVRRTVLISESVKEKRSCLDDLQARAAGHLKDIVHYLFDLNKGVSSRKDWETMILILIRNVVTSVDPNVRAGDKLDIRPFVKVKCIPGGTITESAYIEGVVFRKNVAHKKMVYNKENPKILILSGGIEFHRQDYRLSSLDTLLDQEDKYLEILVDKIMSLNPDIILVGKSVSRRAQELLNSHHVVVFQHVKESLLQRIARMTRAMMLPSTDHMIQQYGSECLGSCGSFSLRLTDVSCGKSKEAEEAFTRIGGGQTRPRITSAVTGTTYVYFNGCEPQLGCTIVLRGASKPDLKQIKSIITYCVMAAYHLRLEVAFYADRCAQLPASPDSEEYTDDSDNDECLSEYLSNLDSFVSDEKPPAESVLQAISEKGRFSRYLLSQSLDIDVGLPYRSELRSVGGPVKKSNSLELNPWALSPMEHQSLNVASILMLEGHNQRGRPEIKKIQYYTEQDVPLGQFLIESCFHLVGPAAKSGHGKINMLEHTLSFVHRPGRLDIATFKAESIFGPGGDIHHSGGSSSQSAQQAGAGTEGEWELRDYLRNVQLKMSHYCKVCKALVTPDVTMSDETWKMSFGKYLEMSFYNRSARCRTGGCTHAIRDNHIHFFFCDEGYIARFEFHPLHPLTISIRQKMPLPVEFHKTLAINMLERLTRLKDFLLEDFRMGIALIEKLSKEYLVPYPNAMFLASTDISVVKKLLSNFNATMTEELNAVANELLNESTPAEWNETESYGIPTASSEVASASPAHDIPMSLNCRFPAILKRDMFIRSLAWKIRLKRIHDYIEALRAKFSQLKDAPPTAPLATPSGVVSPQAEKSAAAATQPTSPEDVDVKSIRDMFMTDLTLPYERNPGITEGIFGEAIEEIEEAAMKFVFNPALSTVEAAVSTVVNISQTAATIFGADKGDVHDSGDASAPKPDESPTATEGNVDLNAAGDATKPPLVPIGLSSPFDAEKKNSRISKLRTKLKGKEAVVDAVAAGGAFSELSEGRLGLPPGRDGIVVEVHEEELATVIAYSLASVEYHAMANEYLLQDDLYNNVQNIGEASGNSNSPTRPVSARNINSSSGSSLRPAVTAPLSHEKRGDTNVRLASPASPSLQRMPSTIQVDFDDEDQHEGEVTDAHLTVDADMFALAEEKLGAAFAEEDAVSAEESQQDLRVRTDSEKFSAFSDGMKDNTDEGGEKGAYEKFQTAALAASRDDSRSQRSRIIEKRLLSQRKSHVKHRFVEYTEKETESCKFICHTFWACQFEALRAVFLEDDGDEGYIRSLGASAKWQAQGGKSGASFSKTLDGRFVVKYITRTELQMFLDFAPAYFEYTQKVFFLGLPTKLCKIVGVYQIGYHNRVTGKKVMEQVVVMENLFFERNITRIFDLKGSTRARYVNAKDGSSAENFEQILDSRRKARKEGKEYPHRPLASQVLLDHNLMELTDGKPLPLKYKANARFHKAVLNDTLFLSIINVVDYSILVGIDEDTQEIVVGIIDYMRQYDIIKRMERMGKSVGMIAGQAEPTVIQPVQYRKRFVAAMDKYFMAVPDKWSQMK